MPRLHVAWVSSHSLDLTVFMAFSFSEFITSVTSPLAATIADNDSDKDNGLVMQGSLSRSFAGKYL